MIVNLKHIDMQAFMADAEMLAKLRVRNAVKKESNIKVNTILTCEYAIIKHGEEVISTKHFNMKNTPMCVTMNLTEWFQSGVKEPILRDMEQLQEKDSGWTLRSIVNLMLNIDTYNPMRGGTYVQLPAQIKNKQACVNVHSNDALCFKWAILSALHPVAHGNNVKLVSKYARYEHELNFDGIEFPVMPRAIPQLEQQNDISVNVYILHKDKKSFTVSPTHITGCKKDTHVNLLLIQDSYDDEDEQYDENDYIMITYHYVWIKNLSQLVSTNLKQQNIYAIDAFIILTVRLHSITTLSIVRKEISAVLIFQHKVVFKNFHFKETVPFVIYADCECFLKRTEQDPTNTTEVVWFKYTNHLVLAENLERVYESPVPMEPLTTSQQDSSLNQHNATSLNDRS